MAEDADRLVARAIESVLDQVPGGADAATPELASAKLQPWAETAAPVGVRGKRPLEELLVELATRVEQHPGVMAELPHARHPAITFFERFSGRPRGAVEREAAGEPGSGRRRRRRRGGGGAAESAAASSPPLAGVEPGAAGRRRSRRGRGRGGASRPATTGAGAPPSTASTAPGETASGSRGGESRPPGAGRRRRGRRGRGGGAGAAPS